MNREEYLRLHTKPTPEKYCEYCGKKLERKQYPNSREDVSLFMRRKYCDIECMRRAFVIKDASNQGWESAHASARKIVHLIEQRDVVCELCGSTKNVDIHHKDFNHQNNSSDNLMLVCRSCHLKLHRQKSTCMICGEPAKGHGYCNKHLTMWKKYGDPLHEPWSTYKEKASKGPVLQYDLNGNLVAEYDSLRDAARITGYRKGSITNVCNGGRKTFKGFIWKYGD